MKLVIDMNLSADWVPALKSVGIDAIHWRSIGPQDAADETIMAWAGANDAVILTRDLDFSTALLLEARKAPSVIQLRIEQVRSQRDLPLVRDAVTFFREHLERGAIITLDGRRTRIRRLTDDVQP